MSNAPILDTSIQRAHEWLHDVGCGLGFDNERTAYAAVRATLHALRDRLPVELVTHFGAGVPTMIRGIYYDGWHPSAGRLREAHAEDFRQSMQRELHGHRELQNTEQVAIAVMGSCTSAWMRAKSTISSTPCRSRCASCGASHASEAPRGSRRVPGYRGDWRISRRV